MTRRAHEARMAREQFQRALAAGVTIEQLRRREAETRWQDADRRLAERRCGTVDEGGRELAWYQR